MPNIFQRIDRRARGKALLDVHPEIGTRQHILSTRSDAIALGPYTYLNAIASHENHVWVRKGVNVIADNSAPLPLFILRGGKDRVDVHPVLDLLNKPNSKMAAADLWRWWVTDMLLGGETGWELTKTASGGKVTEIWPRQPHTIGIVTDPALVRYFEVKRYEIDDGKGDPYSLQPDEFIFYKFFNPRNPWRGIAVLLALRMSITIDVFAQAHEKYLYANNARPDFAIVAPQGTTQTERDDLEKKVEQKFGGTGAGGVLALEDQVTDIRILSFRPKDLGDLEVRRMTRDEIAGGLGVPDILMGFGSDSYDTEQKRTAAIQALYSLTIKPLLGFRDGHLTFELQRLNLLKPDETIHTDYSSVRELQEEEDAEWKRASEQIERGTLTINDWRRAKGLDPYPWGDVWWADANKVPITDAAPLPAPESQALQTVRLNAPALSGRLTEDLMTVITILANAVALNNVIQSNTRADQPVQQDDR